MRRLASILLLLPIAFGALAQNTIKVSVQNLVALDEQFNVTFTIEGEGRVSSFEWEPGDDFQLVWGPQKGSSTSISIINGKKTQTSQTTYTYVLMPRATGTFRLPGATATLKGEQLSSRSVSIQVVSNGSQGSVQGQSSPDGSSQGGSQTGGASSQSSPGEGDIFMRLSLSKTKAVVGETITATLKLYHRVNIAGFEDARFPTFNGFWSQELQAPKNIEFHRESVGDRIYDAAVLRSWTLIPQQSGEVTIDPAELVCLVNVRSQRAQSGSIFDSFFQDDYHTVRKRVTTPAIKVQVSRLPAGAPESFGGGVGSFRMNASLTRDSLLTHDAASLKVTVTGKGNISLLEAPRINFPPDFEVYDVKSTEGAGSKTFEYPFIPRSHGEFTIGPVEYSYYDASAGKYVTLKSAPLPLKVGKNAAGSASQDGGIQLAPAPNRKDVRDLGSDIRYISTALPSFSREGKMFAGSSAFWLIAAALCLLAAALYFILRSVTARRADTVRTRKSGATKMARKRLSLAGDFLSKDLYSAFYEELHKALLGFVSDKLNLPAADLGKEKISERLLSEGVTPELAGRFTALLDACEFARYAPSEGHEAMQAHYENALGVISEIDSSMRKPHKGGSGAAVAALLALLSLPLAAQEPSDLWEEGTRAYAEGQWADARSAWEGIASQGLGSARLYYNIGNACYKESDISHAIIWYERALKADPSFADARHNLEFARGQVQDRIEEVPEFFLKTWMRKLCWLMPSGAWAVVFLVLLAAALGLLLLFLLGSGRARKAGFFAALLALLLSLPALHFSLWQRSDALSRDEAVITAPVTEVKSSPGSGVNLFVLHEGTKVKVLEQIGEWSNIELADGRQGWMKNEFFDYICTFGK